MALRNAVGEGDLEAVVSTPDGRAGPDGRQVILFRRRQPAEEMLSHSGEMIWSSARDQPPALRSDDREEPAGIGGATLAARVALAVEAIDQAG